MTALPLVAALLLGAARPCYLVTNHEIVTVPRCDFSPEAIQALIAAEPPDPADGRPGASPYGPAGAPYRPGPYAPGWQGPYRPSPYRR